MLRSFCHVNARATRSSVTVLRIKIPLRNESTKVANHTRTKALYISSWIWDSRRSLPEPEIGWSTMAQRFWMQARHQIRCGSDKDSWSHQGCKSHFDQTPSQLNLETAAEADQIPEPGGGRSTMTQRFRIQAKHQVNCESGIKVHRNKWRHQGRKSHSDQSLASWI